MVLSKILLIPLRTGSKIWSPFNAKNNANSLPRIQNKQPTWNFLHSLFRPQNLARRPPSRSNKPYRALFLRGCRPLWRQPHAWNENCPSLRNLHLIHKNRLVSTIRQLFKLFQPGFSYFRFLYRLIARILQRLSFRVNPYFPSKRSPIEIRQAKTYRKTHIWGGSQFFWPTAQK